jgi:eukaryotic-like serine/threonine-protein kinase
MANKFVTGFLHSKWWAKLLIGIASLLLFLVLVNWLLKFMTNHGQSLPVPKVKGLVYDEATRLLDEKDLRYVVFDSVYMPKAKPNQVVDQNPAEGTKVKKNRIVYLTINARPVPIVKVPDILDIGLREAVSKLTAEGLEVGEITTRADLSVNRVLGMSHNGKRIKAGDEIEKGSKIDLVISKGEDASDKNIVMPDLAGLTLDEATIELCLLGLNIGAVSYDKNVTDKITAKIYRQTPESGRGAYIGQEIDLFLKQSD